MFKPKQRPLSAAVAAAMAGGAIGALFPLAVQAQDASTQRIEITGSSIKRIDAEGAVPVQVIKREDIARSGATTTTDLLQRLPAIQGGFGESSSVGGGAGGYTGVSIHNLGDTRTLVLLNGHRLTQFGGQLLTGFAAGFDLNAVPLSAIERVEILTDGASAIYGADAIAGVVNFITRRDSTEGDVSIGYSSPKGGAQETRLTATKGFGSLAKDGYNFMLTLSHDERTKLDAKDRNFGATGRVFFSYNGKNYRKQQFSPSPIPANVLDDLGQLVSPYLLTNGSCPDKTFRVTEPYNDGSGLVDDYCGFDFVGELEIFPVRKSDALFASANFRVGEHQLSADLLASKTKQVSRIAPVPGSINIPAGTPLHNQYLAPLGIADDSIAFYRIYDLGLRENRDSPTFFDLALGSKGIVLGWDYNAGLTYSKSDSKTEIAGYPGARAVGRLRASGFLDPFVGPGQQTSAGAAAVAATSYNGYWDGGTAELTSVFARGSREVGTLPGGPVLVGLGVNYGIEKFQSKPSLFAQGKLADPVAGTLCDPLATATNNPQLRCDTRFGDEAATVPYGADRKTAGLFGEVVLPVIKGLEVSGSARFDKYSDFGDATTFKGTVRWQPRKEFLVRASLGTGFHAPTVPQVNAVLQPFGVTSDNYTCGPALQQIATSLGVQCRPGNVQYDVLSGGNPNLKPEKSKQATIGLRVEPSPQLSLGMDLWHVNLRDTFGQLSEQEVFANPQRYASSWGTRVDVGTGVTYLAFKADNRNLGRQYSTGIDFDIEGRSKLGIGDLTSNFKLTYMVREVAQTQIDGPFYSAIGNFAELGGVTFRWQGKWINTLRTGNWTHTAQVNLRSGYLDQATDAEVLDAAGNVTGVETLRLPVNEYITIDWRSAWMPTKNIEVAVGALNLFDHKPPLAISTGGVNRGQQFGYDDRYYDSRGRTFYINASYKF
jgi:iron complex outermembrane recepter protein